MLVQQNARFSVFANFIIKTQNCYLFMNGEQAYETQLKKYMVKCK